MIWGVVMKEVSNCMKVISPIAALCGIIIFFGCDPAPSYRIYVVMCAVITIINSFLQVKYGDQNSLTTEIITAIIGGIVGASTEAGIIYGISIALCIADLVMLVFGWLSIIFTKGIREKDETEHTYESSYNSPSDNTYKTISIGVRDSDNEKNHQYKTISLDENILNEGEQKTKHKEEYKNRIIDNGRITKYQDLLLNEIEYLDDSKEPDSTNNSNELTIKDLKMCPRCHKVTQKNHCIWCGYGLPDYSLVGNTNNKGQVVVAFGWECFGCGHINNNPIILDCEKCKRSRVDDDIIRFVAKHMNPDGTFETIIKESKN